MPQYDNTNTGALFKADKQGNDKRPDYKGPANVDGTEKEMAAWITKDRNGNTFMRIKFEDKRDRQQQSGGQQRQDPQAPLQGGGGDPFDDGDAVPFAPVKLLP